MPPPQALPDRIYGAVKHRILTCALMPGQRLLEKDLSEELGVSRTPVREALNRLSLERLVVLKPYRGYAVSEVLLEDIRNLSELRIIVESEAAALAAVRATPEEVEDLRSLAELRYQPKDRATYAQYLRDNSVFHQALARCSRNERLEGIVSSILDEIQRPLYLGLDEGLDPETATAEHLGVVDAIAARDAALAKRLMAEQIASTQDRIFAAVVSIQTDQLETRAPAAR